MASPPPSFSRSGWLGTAWQEEQPPALNIVTPLARFAVRGASEAEATTAGTVNHQKMPAPSAPARIKPRRIRRSIHRSVIEPSNSTISMNALYAAGFHEISGVCRRFGNKFVKPLFRLTGPFDVNRRNTMSNKTMLVTFALGAAIAFVGPAFADK